MDSVGAFDGFEEFGCGFDSFGSVDGPGCLLCAGFFFFWFGEEFCLFHFGTKVFDPEFDLGGDGVGGVELFEEEFEEGSFFVGECGEGAEEVGLLGLVVE